MPRGSLSTRRTTNFTSPTPATTSVRAINLTDGTISTIAGGGPSVLAAPYGDGGAPTSAYLLTPTHVSISGDTLYVTDSGHGSIRSVSGLSLGGTQINTFIQSSTTQCASQAAAIYGCGSADSSCNIVWDGATAYVAAQLCGTQTGYTPGVVKISGGVTTPVVGKAGGAATDGALANNTVLGAIPVIALDANKILYMSIQSEQRIRKLDATQATPSVQTVAGTAGTYGSTGDKGPATAALFYNPASIAVKSGHLVVADAYSYAIREIW